MGRSVYIGRIFGIEFRLHYTWFITFFLLTFLLVEPDYQRLSMWLIGICTSILFFSSVFAHELAHSLVGRANGIRVSNITLFIFGGMAMMENEPDRPGAEFRMAIAGPACSLLLGIVFGLLLLIPGLNGPVAGMFTWLAIMNGMLAIFNLVPGFPLDGGRVLRSAIWKKTGSYFLASRIAAIIGVGLGYLFIVAGILIVIIRPFGMDWGDGLWIAAIGWFLSNAASSSLRSSVKKSQQPPAASRSEITDAEYTVKNDDREEAN